MDSGLRSRNYPCVVIKEECDVSGDSGLNPSQGVVNADYITEVVVKKEYDLDKDGEPDPCRSTFNEDWTPAAMKDDFGVNGDDRLNPVHCALDAQNATDVIIKEECDLEREGEPNLCQSMLLQVWTPTLTEADFGLLRQNITGVKRRKKAIALQENIDKIEELSSFPCNMCDKTFSRKSNLARHSMLHNGQKPFLCYFCKKQFTQKSQLTYHIMTHTGEKPYSCNICSKAVATRYQLSLHIMTHTGEKPFSCQICKKAFSRKGSLFRHSILHSDEKPFECYYCNRKFTQKSHLGEHMNTHTSKEPVKTYARKRQRPIYNKKIFTKS